MALACCPRCRSHVRAGPTCPWCAAALPALGALLLGLSAGCNPPPQPTYGVAPADHAEELRADPDPRPCEPDEADRGTS